MSMLKKLKGSKQSTLSQSVGSARPRQTRQPRAQLLGFGKFNAEKWVPVARCSGSRQSGFDRRFSIRTAATSVGRCWTAEG